MAALKPVAGVVRIKHGLSVGADLTTGWHLYLTYGQTAPTPAQLTTMCGSIASAWNTDFAPLSGAATILTSVVATDLAAPDAAQGAWSGSHPGTRTGTGLPASASVLVNFGIARRYRGGKPRVYIPAGTGTDTQTPQTWTGAFMTLFGTNWANFVSAVVFAVNVWGSGAQLVNVSYYEDGVWKPDHLGNYHRIPTPRDVPKVDPITSQTPSTTISSQRRRLRPA